MPKPKPSFQFGEDRSTIEANAKAVQADFGEQAGKGSNHERNAARAPERKRQVNVRVSRALVLAVEEAALREKAQEKSQLTTMTAMVERGLRLVLADLDQHTPSSNQEVKDG